MNKEKAAYLGRAARGKEVMSSRRSGATGNSARAMPGAPAGTMKSLKAVLQSRNAGLEQRLAARSAIASARSLASSRASSVSGGPGGDAHATAIRKSGASIRATQSLRVKLAAKAQEQETRRQRDREQAGGAGLAKVRVAQAQPVKVAQAQYRKVIAQKIANRNASPAARLEARQAINYGRQHATKAGRNVTKTNRSRRLENAQYEKYGKWLMDKTAAMAAEIRARG